MADVSVSLSFGDWVYSPNGENEWVMVVQVLSTTNWTYLVLSTLTVTAAVIDYTTLTPDRFRSGGGEGPRKPG